MKLNKAITGKYVKIVRKVEDLKKELGRLKAKGKTIGFVPTMGFLHEGHLSLVRCARKENDIVVVSIFVNPIQFSPNEDFRKYPRNLKRDVKLLGGICDIVFSPSSGELYPKDFCSLVEVRALSDQLCGRTRKGHFAGVATVVAKLFHIISPDNVYFGRKDVQQAVVVKKMVSDLDFPVKIRVLPIVRNKDGLAMSSRNIYLSKKERLDAVVLFQALRSAERMVRQGIKDPAKIKEALSDFISRTESARIDYIEIVNKETLTPLKLIEKDALLLLAVYIGKTRLIDNAVLKTK